MAADNEEHEPMRDGMPDGFHLDIDMTGDTPLEIIETLEMVVLPMLKGGVIHARNESITTGTHFHFMLEPITTGGIFLDGEGMVVCVNDLGVIVSLIRPDGSEDETAAALEMSALEWGMQHKGLVNLRELSAAGPDARKPTELQLRLLESKCEAEGDSWPEGAV